MYNCRQIKGNKNYYVSGHPVYVHLNLRIALLPYTFSTKLEDSLFLLYLILSLKYQNISSVYNSLLHLKEDYNLILLFRKLHIPNRKLRLRI